MYSKNLTIALFILSVPSLQRLLLQWSTEGVWGQSPRRGGTPAPRTSPERETLYLQSCCWKNSIYDRIPCRYC
jgi:hypothetical protein